MSKLQDALNKIQNAGREYGDHRSPDATNAENAVPIAELVEKDTRVSGVDLTDRYLHVDADALRNAGLIAPEYDEQLLADQYRDLKRPLIAHAFGKRATLVDRGNLIMVTSALSGEGKTFTSINLALSMAREKDCSVLLADADVAKPHTSELFGATNELGLLDALEEPGIPVRSLILPTDIDNLSILPAGRPRINSTELLASDAMERVCEELRSISTRQLIVFDSPPLLQTSEAKVLASLVGQVVVVVLAEKTARDAVMGAVGILEDSKAVNLILNQVRKGFDKYQYGYGYGYGKSSRFGSKEAASESPASSDIDDWD